MADGRRTNTKDRYIHLGLMIIGVMYVAALWGVTLGRAGSGARAFQWMPFSIIIEYANAKTTIGGLLKNLLGSFAAYIPLGILLPCLFPRLSLKKAVLVGFLMSLGRELIQYAAAIGVADIDDLILNTLGTLAGAGIYYGLLRAGTIQSARRIALILLIIFGVGGAACVLNDLPVLWPRQIEYVNLQLLGSETPESCDVSGDCQSIGQEGVTLRANAAEDAPAMFRLAPDAVILIQRPTCKQLFNGYIYKTIFTYETSTIEEAQALTANREDVKCDLWIDSNGACRMLVLTDGRA